MADMTPEAWRDKLLGELSTRTAEISQLEAYYNGNHPLPAPPDKTTDEYKRLADLSQTNFCALVVDAVSERLALRGIRLRPTDAADGQPVDDLDVWVRSWQANNLDAESQMVHDKALGVGRSFVMVWPVDVVEGEEIKLAAMAQITPEDPTEVIVAYKPGSRRSRVAALKVYRDDWAKRRYATLFLTDKVYRWEQEVSERALSSEQDTRKWKPWNGEDGLGHEVDNPLKIVPIVEFPCRPDMRGGVTPELSPGVIKVQNRINKTGFDQVVLGEFQAFPQRYSIGITVEEDENGTPINPLKPGPQRVWTLESDDPNSAKIGQLDAADMSGHLARIQADITFLAAMTKTPIYYLQAGMVNVSADAIRAAEAGLIKKVRKHQLVFGEAWEEVVRLALLAVNDPRAADVAMEIDWENPEARSLAELVDAATKKQSVGVPWRQNMEDLGYSPQEIDRMDAERAADSLLSMPTMPTMPATVGAGGA